MGQFFRYLAVMFVRLMIVLVVLVGVAYIGLLLYLNLTDWPEKLAIKSERELGHKIVIGGPVYLGWNPNSPRVIFSDITVEPGKEDNVRLHAESGVMMLHDLYAIFRSRDQIKKVVLTLELNGFSVNGKPVGSSKFDIVYETEKWRVDPFAIGIGKGGITGTAEVAEDRLNMQAVAKAADFSSFMDEKEALLDGQMTLEADLKEDGLWEMHIDPADMRFAGGRFTGAVNADRTQMQVTGRLSNIDYLHLAGKFDALRHLVPPELKDRISGRFDGDMTWRHSEEAGAELRIDPLQVKAGAGSIAGALSYQDEALSFIGKLQEFDYGSFFDGVTGKLDADLDLSALYGAPGNLAGRVVIRAGAGSMEGNLIDLWSGDLVTALQKTAVESNTPFSCAAGVFAVKDGVATGPMVLDTENAVIHGRGSIDLAAQSYDLTFYPQPKQAGGMNLAAPLRITGPWDNPEIAPETTGMILKLGGMLTGSKIGEASIAEAGKDFCAELLEREKATAQ